MKNYEKLRSSKNNSFQNKRGLPLYGRSSEECRIDVLSHQAAIYTQ